MDDKKYMSHSILDEQEQDLFLQARGEIIVEINSAKLFSIICDESTDLSKTEQLSVSVRYCTFDYEMKDAFIGSMPCDGGLTSRAFLGYIMT